MKRRLLCSTMILFLLMITIVCPIEAEQAPSGLSIASLPDEIDAYVQQYIGKTSPGLAVVVFSDNEIIFSKGYGYADISRKKTVASDDTVFEYGSISKIFVYTAIMQLAEAGLIDLDADIRNHLPEGFLRKIRFDVPITMIDIMNHQTGFEDILTDIVITNPVHESEFLDILESRQPEQVYEPGTIVAYSNYAVALAAYVAQNIAGQDFHQYAKQSLLQPAAADAISFLPYFQDNQMRQERRAKGYEQFSAAGTFREIGWSYIPLYPVGAASGTAEELARFAMALMPPDGDSGVLFDNRAALDELLTQTYQMGPGLTGFAHGFIEYDGKATGVGHGGNTAGFSAQLNMIPDQRFGVVVLTNAASEIDLTEGITHLLLGRSDLTDMPTPNQEALPDTEPLAGSYLSARRPHNGFLKLYGFLNLLQVSSTGDHTITVHLGNQSGDYVQAAPYLFKQTNATGSFFEYSFKEIYFDMRNDRVFRVSGDFVPLPGGHTISWLLTDLSLLVVSGLFFLLMPVILLLIWFVSYLKKRKLKPSEPSLMGDQPKSDPSKRCVWVTGIILTSGLALMINNAILVLRMLMDQYRSFSEVIIQLILNIPLTIIGILAMLIGVLQWRNMTFNKRHRNLFVLVSLMLIVLTYLLVKWQFTTLI